MLRPPSAVLQHGRIRRGVESRQQQRLLLAGDGARAAWNRLAFQGPCLALLDDGPFDGGHGHLKAASGFSHGLTVGHRSHQAFFQIGRIGAHAALPASLVPVSAFRKLLYFARKAELFEAVLSIYAPLRPSHPLLDLIDRIPTAVGLAPR